MQVQVKEQEYEELADWYRSKPKYPLHVNVLTTTGFFACITGVRQDVSGEELTWQYQLTQESSGRAMTSWWTEADIREVSPAAIKIEEYEEGEYRFGGGFCGLENVMKHVQSYGQSALEYYRQVGLRCELRIGFWDTAKHAPKRQ